jgi:hypothetical protein
MPFCNPGTTRYSSRINGFTGWSVRGTTQAGVRW